MKKIIITPALLCITLLAAAPSFARDYKSDEQKTHARRGHKPPITFGIEGGLNIATMDEQYYQNDNAYAYKAGLRLGAIVSIPINENFYLEPGLFYAANGAKTSYNDGRYSGTSTLNINSLEIPLNVIYKFGEPGDNRFFVGAGPYIAYNISAHISGTDIDHRDNTYTSYSDTYLIGGTNGVDDIRTVDLGFGVNAGYQLSNGLFFRIRAQRGLANMSPNSGTTLHSSSIGLQVGYFFHKQRSHTRH